MVEPGHSFRYDVALITLGLLAYALASGVSAQVNPPAKKPQTKASKPTAKTEEANPLTLQRRTVAISLLTSLAEEARSFQDQSLRARVQMRAADALWESDAEKARALFRRAWEAAVSADKDSWSRYTEERKRIQSSTEPNRYLQSPPELRREVMRLIAKRDQTLAEEFLEQLTDDVARDTNNPASSNLNPATPQTADPEDPPLAIVQRLQLATQLLEDGDIARAVQFADPALDRVTTRGVLFLSYLREKDMAAADQRFATMLARTVADPSSDAVGVSVLSSYVFTPFLYVIVRGNGQNHTSQSRERIVPPANFPPDLRRAFLAGAAQILLRPPQPVDQDRTVAGRRGLYFTIARLLPLYEQYAPELAPELRAQLSSVAADIPESSRPNERLLTRGLVAEDQNRDEGSEVLERADRVADAAERDMLFARAALIAARKGDVTARDTVEKIADSDLRKRARAHVDFTLVSRAIDRKDAQEVLRLLGTAELSNIHRAWALMEVVRLLKKTDAPRSVEILNEAAVVARRIGGSELDRPRAMVGVATLMFEVDHGRVWEAVLEAVKAVNAVSEYTGEDAQIVARFAMGRGASTTNFTVEGFNLDKIFASLAKEDLYRAIETARSFSADAPRATATLAVARAVLKN